MADEGEDKTEDPSGKKLSDAKEEGQIGQSADLSSAVMLLAGIAVMGAYGGDFANSCMSIMREYFAGYVDWQPSVALGPG